MPRFGTSCEKPQSIDDAGLRVVAHASAAIRVRRRPGRIHAATLDRNRAGGLQPLDSLLLDEERHLAFVLLEVERDPAHGESQRVLHDRIEVQVVVLIGQGGLLQVRVLPPVGVLLDERLPRGTPQGCLAEGVHVCRGDRATVRVDKQVPAADEVETW